MFFLVTPPERFSRTSGVAQALKRNTRYRQWRQDGCLFELAIGFATAAEMERLIGPGATFFRRVCSSGLKRHRSIPDLLSDVDHAVKVTETFATKQLELEWLPRN
jgi:hypothetical protein